MALLVREQIVLKRLQTCEDPIGHPTLAAAKLDADVDTVADADAASARDRVKTESRRRDVRRSLRRFNELTRTWNGALDPREIGPGQRSKQVAQR